MSHSRSGGTPASKFGIGDPPAETTDPQIRREERASRGFVDGLTDAARANPASAALIGIGAAWLLLGGANVSLLGKGFDASRFRSGRSTWGGTDRFPGETAPAGAPHASRPNAADTARSSIEGAGSAASTVASVSSSGVSSVYETVSSATGRAGEAASHLGASAYDASRAAARGTRREAEHLQQTVGEFFESKPLALGILGLAVGAGLAAALPRTEAEQRLMGEASDAAKEQAGTLVAETFDALRGAAGEVVEQVSEEIETQGLTKDGLQAATQAASGKLSNIADAAAKSVRNEVERRTGASDDKPT